MSSLQKFHRRTQPFVVNTLHTGTVSISGTAVVGSVLTASNNIADVDGLGTFTYQWKRSGNNISGANASTYTLVSADAGNTITVTITYTDGKGFIETETSAATATIITPLVFGSGNDTKGYYMGTAGDGYSTMWVAPKSTETNLAWGSSGTLRNTASLTDGVGNTNTLAGFGQAAHPAAYYCKNLTLGGYNTWYLPAKNELLTGISNKTANMQFANTQYLTSTESTAANMWYVEGLSPSAGQGPYKNAVWPTVRAVRRG